MLVIVIGVYESSIKIVQNTIACQIRYFVLCYKQNKSNHFKSYGNIDIKLMHNDNDNSDNTRRTIGINNLSHQSYKTYNNTDITIASEHPIQ